MANAFDPSWDDECDRDGFRSRRARLGRQAGAERLGASLYELPPGEAAWPYHRHLANEELLVVLRGRPSLRGPDGWRELEEGEVVAFPVGDRGAHQIANRSAEPVRFLVVSEMVSPEVVIYPDTGTVGVSETAPGSPEDRLKRFLPLDAAVDYWNGVEPPGGTAESTA